MKSLRRFSLCSVILALLLAPASLFGQLSTEQKLADFQYLAGLYAKRYGPYEWKRDVLKVDLLNLSTWLPRVSASKSDLEFFDLMSEYVANLNDAHSVYILPSSYTAYLNFVVDIYDGKLLVDSINRTRLPASEFGFVTGYELVSIDGESAQTLLDRYTRYGIAANAHSTSRFAAQYITYRPQQIIPNATSAPDISTVVFRRPDGGLETYRIPWARAGLPLTSVGKYITPSAARRPTAESIDELPPENPDYLQVLQRLQNCTLPDRGVLNFGSVQPIFVNALPPDFSLRLGFTGDPFFSGVFTSGGYRIGYLRIPSYAPADANLALTLLAREIAYFQANTDGLIIDEMRNPGGSVSYANAVASYLIPTPWTAIGFEVRATSEWVVGFSASYESAKAQGAPPDILALLQQLKDTIQSANRQMHGRTPSIPLDDLTLDRVPATDARGNVVAYRKPILMLIDEMSASAADLVAATFQDNARGPLFGWRTMGAGGNVEPWEGGSYSLGTAEVTESLMVRNKDVTTPDYPVTRYVENVGVRPDIEADYMTASNLRSGGADFVDAFSRAIVDLIKNTAKPTEVKP
ncbi:MAG TPA: S41 family peptidase [Paludibaculum sp.]|jgi:hypothetical protein